MCHSWALYLFSEADWVDYIKLFVLNPAVMVPRPGTTSLGLLLFHLVAVFPWLLLASGRMTQGIPDDVFLPKAADKLKLIASHVGVLA